jgi:16S rRNA pseudouridine516 synthase
MQRLDKYLANLWLLSRREAPLSCKKGEILLNWGIAKKSDIKIKEWDRITYKWQEIEVLENIYAILYKSSGYISSDEDEFWYPSYKKQMLSCPYVNLLHVAWRLDVDTEWLLLLSNDGQFIHQVISPKRDKEKEYEVHLEKEISDEDCIKLENWVILDDGYKTKPAKVKKLEDKKILLTITEWKYHQVKRMLESLNNKVIYLKRIRIANRNLDWLKKGDWKLIQPPQ